MMSPRTDRLSRPRTAARSWSGVSPALATSRNRPASRAASSTASVTDAKNGSPIDSMIRPTASSRPIRSERAFGLAW